MNAYAAQANTESNEMEQSKLDEIIRKHDLWLNGKEDGERADLSSANLRSANLSYADLRSADLSYANLSYANLRSANLSENKLWSTTGNGINVMFLQTDQYDITYTAEVMQIGCEQHDIKDWWKFDDERINSMDRGTSLEWWKVWKPILKKMIKASPAKPTGYVEPEETAAA